MEIGLIFVWFLNSNTDSSNKSENTDIYSRKDEHVSHNYYSPLDYEEEGYDGDYFDFRKYEWNYSKYFEEQDEYPLKVLDNEAKRLKCIKWSEFREYIRTENDWPDDLSYWEDSKSKKIEAKLNEIKQRRRENHYFINRKENLQAILFYKEYHPYYNGQNHLFNDFSRLVLQLKQNNSSAVTYFADILHNYLGDNFTIVNIPSHNPTKSNTGINSVVQELIFRGSGRIDGTLCLKRRYLIDKLSLGGDRSINTQLSSMFVDNLELIIDKKVLLIDDVSSTGNSLRAGRKLLLSAGAREVQAFSIAKTIT